MEAEVEAEPSSGRPPQHKSSPETTRPLGCYFSGAPGAIRTHDTRFRRAVLYPLSYEGKSDTSRAWGAPAVRMYILQFVERQVYVCLVIRRAAERDAVAAHLAQRYVGNVHIVEEVRERLDVLGGHRDDDAAHKR